MSRMSTSLASFSWARSAIRRAWSRDVRWGKAPRSLGIRVSPVQGGNLYFPGDRVRKQLAQVLAPSDAVADVRRRGVHGRDLEELDPIRSLQLREDRLEPFPGIAGTSRHAQPGELEHAVRVLPGEEAGELVRPDEEKRIVEPLSAKGVD